MLSKNGGFIHEKRFLELIENAVSDDSPTALSMRVSENDLSICRCSSQKRVWIATKHIIIFKNFGTFHLFCLPCASLLSDLIYVWQAMDG